MWQSRRCHRCQSPSCCPSLSSTAGCQLLCEITREPVTLFVTHSLIDPLEAAPDAINTATGKRLQSIHRAPCSALPRPPAIRVPARQKESVLQHASSQPAACAHVAGQPLVSLFLVLAQLGTLQPGMKAAAGACGVQGLLNMRQAGCTCTLAGSCSNVQSSGRQALGCTAQASPTCRKSFFSRYCRTGAAAAAAAASQREPFGTVRITIH